MHRWIQRCGVTIAAAIAMLGPLSWEPNADADSLALEVATTHPQRQPRYQWTPLLDPEATADTADTPGALDRRFASLADALPNAATGWLRPDAVESLHSTIARVAGRADVAVHARDLRTGAVLFDHRGQTPLNPASNNKVLTAAVALELLGPQYTFETSLFRLDRTLYLKGTGDPALDRDDLHAIAVLASELVDVGEIDRLVVDDTAFSEERFGPGYIREGTSAAYQAPSGALSVDFNTIEVRVAPGKDMPVVTVDAAGSHVEVRNDAKMGRRSSVAIRTFAEDDKTIVHVVGTMRRRGRVVAARKRILDPGLHAGSVFASLLADLSQTEPLTVSRGDVPPNAQTLVVNDSAPLVDVLDRGLAYSNNFVAEQVLRTMAWRVFRAPGTWEDGRELIEAYWIGLGREPDQLVVENGSGLSSRGRMTPAGMVDVLNIGHLEGGALLEALPVAGEPGTLRGRLRRSRGRVRAKTGTLNGVSGLSGVIDGTDGTPAIAFSVLVNVHASRRMVAKSRRRVEDRIVSTLLAELDARAAVDSKG